MTITRTNRFKKEFNRLPEQIQKRTLKQLELFLQNPHHPSLNTKKMEGYGDIWEARITRGYRFTFKIEKVNYELRRIGTHDILDNP